MPTGSLAPDSPSSRVPERPPISRRPSTEKTTAGSVGARATPSSRAGAPVEAEDADGPAAATPTVVTSVPTTPIHSTAPAADRNRRQPMCMPPSNSSRISITVTTRWTVMTGRSSRPGTVCDATAAATRKMAGAGTRIRSLSRLDQTASSPATLTTATSSAKGTTSVTVCVSRCAGGRPWSGSSRTCGTCCRPGFPAHRDRAYRCSQVGGCGPATGQRPWSRPHAVVSQSRQVQRSTGLSLPCAVAAQPGQHPAGQVGQLLLLVAGQDLHGARGARRRVRR